MSEYIVSARKYRPSTFKSVVGQKTLTSTLKNAIDSKRLAQAYLFCGPRGVGKTSCARIFAKTINCLNPTEDGEACGECESCRSIDRGNSFNIIELDAASNNSVDDIRALTEEVNVPPQVGNYRVFIIDEVHMLSTSAFNAFLKTLEEPPKYVVFVLATTEKHKVIPTILSRCQIYDFKRITTVDIVEHLQYVASQEGIEASAEALNVIARKADGGMRDALSIFDQIASSSMGHITYQSALANLNVLDYDYYFRLVEAFRAGDVGTSLLIFNEIQEKGFDTLFFINGLATHIRDLMVAADSRTAKLLEVAEEVIEKYTVQARSLPLPWYFAALKIVNDTDYSFRTATNKQILVELMLIRLCQLLNPPTPPFDRVDDEPPLKMPSRIGDVIIPAASSTSTASPNPVSDTSAKPVVEIEAKIVTEVSTMPKSDSESGAQKVVARRTPRLTDMKAKMEEEASKNQDRRKPISQEAIEAAWNAFAMKNQEKQILVGAMKDLRPIKTADEEYIIKVAHPAQEQAFNVNLTHLLKYLRDSLQNDFISLKIMIDDSIEVIKPMPPKELFQDIVKSNPSLASLASQLDVEIV